MKDIGRVYEIPYSGEHSDLTSRTSLVAALMRKGYNVETDPNFIGNIYYSHAKPTLIGRILSKEVITINSPELEKILETLHMKQIPEDDGK